MDQDPWSQCLVHKSEAYEAVVQLPEPDAQTVSPTISIHKPQEMSVIVGKGTRPAAYHGISADEVEVLEGLRQSCGRLDALAYTSCDGDRDPVVGDAAEGVEAKMCKTVRTSSVIRQPIEPSSDKTDSSVLAVWIEVSSPRVSDRFGP